MTTKIKNPKHRQFKNSVIKTKNPAISYQEIYPKASEDTARINSIKLLNKPEIISAISEGLNNQGLSLTDLHCKLSKFTEVDKAVVTKFGVEFVPDNSTQLESVKTAYKLHGLLKTGDVKTENTYNDNRLLNVNANDSQSMLGLCDRIDALNDNLKQARARREVAIEP